METFKMTKDEFKSLLFSHEFARFTALEKKALSELLEKLEINNEAFFDELFFLLITRFKFFSLKEFKECFLELIEQEVLKLCKNSKIKNFDTRLFLSEGDFLSRFYKKKLLKNLPKWIL